MDEMLKKLMKKKGREEEPDSSSMEAKIKVLEELRDMMAQMMGDKMRNGYDEMKKVSVMAPDEKGLKAGLGQAQELVEDIPDHPLLGEDDNEAQDDIDAEPTDEENVLENADDESELNKRKNMRR